MMERLAERRIQRDEGSTIEGEDADEDDDNLGHDAAEDDEEYYDDDSEDDDDVSHDDNHGGSEGENEHDDEEDDDDDDEEDDEDDDDDDEEEEVKLMKFVSSGLLTPLFSAAGITISGTSLTILERRNSVSKKGVVCSRSLQQECLNNVSYRLIVKR